VPQKLCAEIKKMSGLFGGAICMEDTMDATAVLMNLSRWVNFRGTLYFLAMFGTIITCVLIVIVHRTKNPPNFNQNYQPVPVSFTGTPLYHVMRTAWFVSSFMVFFWIVTEMYQYWWFIGYYKSHSTGALHEFWDKFDKKFVTTVVFAGLYLCWPLCNLLLEIAFWMVLGPLWFLVRSCQQGLETTRMPSETDLHDIPCWIRLDMFFCECQQFRRIGFSTKLWEIVTGTRTAWLEEFGQPMQQGGGGGYPQQQQQGGYPQQQQGGGGGGGYPQSQQQQATTPSRGGTQAPQQQQPQQQFRPGPQAQSPSGQWGAPPPMTAQGMRASGSQDSFVRTSMALSESDNEQSSKKKDKPKKHKKSHDNETDEERSRRKADKKRHSNA
jgi:hypothetical protein